MIEYDGRMSHRGLDEREQDILISLGRLSLAAASAEVNFALAFFSLLSGSHSYEDAKRAADSMRARKVFSDLLGVVSDTYSQPLGEIRKTVEYLHLAEPHKDLYLDHWLRKHANGKPAGYIRHVNRLYEKRNQCLHSYSLRIENDDIHLQKASGDIRPEDLAEALLVRVPGHTFPMAMVIDQLALELELSSYTLISVAKLLWAHRHPDFARQKVKSLGLMGLGLAGLAAARKTEPEGA